MHGQVIEDISHDVNIVGLDHHGFGRRINRDHTHLVLLDRNPFEEGLHHIARSLHSALIPFRATILQPHTRRNIEDQYHVAIILRLNNIRIMHSWCHEQKDTQRPAHRRAGQGSQQGCQSSPMTRPPAWPKGKCFNTSNSAEVEPLSHPHQQKCEKGGSHRDGKACLYHGVYLNPKKVRAVSPSNASPATEKGQ